MLFRNNNVVVRSLTEEDAVWLAKWLSDPQVLAYYEGRDRPHDLDLVRKHFYEDGEDDSRCIVEFNEKAIGYVQFYPISEEERILYGYRADEAVYGMDQFIGETEYWNRGIGTSLIMSTRDYLVSIGAEVVVMDPQAWNHRALRCYEKSGFKKVKLLPEHEWHEGAKRDCWLIEFRRVGDGEDQ